MDRKWQTAVQHLTKDDSTIISRSGQKVTYSDHQKWAEGDRQQDNNHQKYAEGNSNRKQWQTARQRWIEVNRLQDWQSCGQQKAGTVQEAENKNQPFHSGSTLVSVGESPDTSGSEAVNQSITWTCVNAFHSLTLFLPLMMNWWLMSSDVMRHIRDKLWPMPKHGAINLYVHGNQKAR